MNLEQEFSELLEANIIIPEIKKTIFDIAGFPHYENTLSNFYAYYFDPSESHGLNDLMISVLNKIVFKKLKSTCIDNYKEITVEREVRTKSGKYIDILISERSNDQKLSQNIVVIENKVNAPLYNDFDDYFNHKDALNKKIGIILSLKDQKLLPANFINITHQELVSNVLQESGSYFLNADSKSLIFFKEFIQNIMNMTSSSELSTQYDFYLKHESKIREIIKLRDLIVQDAHRQINEACEDLQMQLELGSAGSYSSRIYYSSKAPVYFTIWIEDLFDEDESIGIFIELDETGMKYIDEINKIDFDNGEKSILKETTPIRKSYIHYAEVSTYVDEQGFKNIKKFICDKISGSPLKSIFQKIENRLMELNASW